MTEYQYSSGLTLTFIDEKEEFLTTHLYVLNIFENNVDFQKLNVLKVGDKKYIRGWVTEENCHYSLFDLSALSNIKEDE